MLFTYREQPAAHICTFYSTYLHIQFRVPHTHVHVYNHKIGSKKKQKRIKLKKKNK